MQTSSIIRVFFSFQTLILFSVCFLLWIDFGSSVRKLIGSKSSSPAAHGTSQIANGSSTATPSRSSNSTGNKLSSYFQRSSSATSSGFRRTGHLPLSNSLSGSSIGLNGGNNQRSPLLPPSVLPSDLCPSCLMPFDKNRKRRLIDSCGHERCYACLFSSELCPLCSPGKQSVKLWLYFCCVFRSINEEYKPTGRETAIQRENKYCKTPLEARESRKCVTEPNWGISVAKRNIKRERERRAIESIGSAICIYGDTTTKTTTYYCCCDGRLYSLDILSHLRPRWRIGPSSTLGLFHRLF